MAGNSNSHAYIFVVDLICMRNAYLGLIPAVAPSLLQFAILGEGAEGTYSCGVRGKL